MPNLLDKSFPLKEETYQIIGAAMNVHKSLGFGFLEKVYQEALEIEFHSNKIPFKREEPIEIQYNNQILKQKYMADFICYDSVIVELKAVSELSNAHEAQLFNYLKATNLKVGLLLNFGERSLRYKRINIQDYF